MKSWSEPTGTTLAQGPAEPSRLELIDQVMRLERKVDWLISTLHSVARHHEIDAVARPPVATGAWDSEIKDPTK
ncbi:MAG: hypothetical protein AB7K67_01115 [Hyphomicrobiaceae bacterium]